MGSRSGLGSDEPPHTWRGRAQCSSGFMRYCGPAPCPSRLRLRWRQLASGGRVEMSVTRMPGTGRGWARTTWKKTLDVLKTAAAARMSSTRGFLRVS